jgi:putative transposase
VRIFAFVAAQKSDFPVRTLCRVCKVSASGFYAYAAWLAGGPGPAAAARAVTAAHITRVHAASRRRYGSPRVRPQLAREGIVVNHKAVEREMARQGLAGRCSRRKVRTTRRDPSQAPAADLVRREFGRSRTDELWIGDATYIWTDEGWCYLATLVDACSRRLLGWSVTDRLRTQLCLDALAADRGPRRPPEPRSRDRFSHRSRHPVHRRGVPGRVPVAGHHPVHGHHSRRGASPDIHLV